MNIENKIKIEKANKALEEGGFSLLLKRTYRFVLTRVLPSKPVSYNGVKVMEGKRLNFLIPGNQFGGRPNYEKGILAAMEAHLRKDDNVLIIGGGRGVTAIKAKDIVGDKGRVIVYEPAKEMIEKIKKNVNLNGKSIDKIIHASVGTAQHPWGDASNSKKIDPKKLPECNILELDCEGSEIEILENLEIEPRIIIAESHGFYGASTEEVKIKLQEMNYRIIDEKYAEDSKYCQNKDIKVITSKFDE